MHIICAVDGSEFSEWGVQFLEALSARPPSMVTLLHVVDTPPTKSGAAVKRAPAKRLAAALNKAGTQILRRMAGIAKAGLGQAFTKPHTKIRSILAHGSIAATITKEAKRHNADLVVLGSRGLSDVKGFLLGSVSRKVAALAPFPLLVIKRSPTKLDHVLLAVDASRHSRAAAGFLNKEFLPESARVTVLSVVEPVVTELAARYVPASQLEELLKPKQDKAAQLTRQFRDWFLKEGYAVTTEIIRDHVADGILKYATRSHADLLVTGSRGLIGSERLQLGSVSETLLKYAGCSVLIVRGWRG